MPAEQHDYPADLAEMVAWVEAHATPGQRVLDIGCGDGSMVERLSERFDAVGVDPNATPADHVVVAALEDYEAEPFDVVFASVSLHHLRDLDRAGAALRRLTRPGTVVLVREFDRELVMDDATLRWWYEQRQALPTPPGRHGDERSHDHDHSHSHDHEHGHAEQHGEEQMPDTYDGFRARLTAMFDEHVWPWTTVESLLHGAGFVAQSRQAAPYLFRWDLPESVRPVEEALIGEGRIRAVGVRWLGHVPS